MDPDVKRISCVLESSVEILVGDYKKIKKAFKIYDERIWYVRLCCGTDEHPRMDLEMRLRLDFLSILYNSSRSPGRFEGPKAGF